MLFNTLAYAQFFAFVFLTVWLLARRCNRVWIPWLAVAFLVTLGPTAQWPPADGLGWVTMTALGAATALLAHVGRRGEGQHATAVLLVSCALNGVALTFLTARTEDTNLLDAGFLAAFGTSPWGGIEGTLGGLASISAAALLFALLQARRVRLLFILGASYVFYAHWDWRFLPLIFASSSVDFWLGMKIGHTKDPRLRRRWLWVTVALNLGVLAFFKYLNFGIDTARALLESMDLEAPESALRIALPVGISFFTFESMSYVIDVYRKELEPHKSYLEYLSFVAFFPHLVAGPIVRPRDLLPQLAGPPRWRSADGSEGLFLIAVGLLKKIAIGDLLAVNLIDRAFDAPTQYSALECYVAVVSYAVQIYCDFSGYTDIAIGSALLLGIRFPLNFNAPYKAWNIQEFWSRWHISLSTWLRDYLYIPLGGNRRGKARTYINLMATMLLGGLWHGATWSFVLWGGLHGAALAIHRATKSVLPQSNSIWLRALGIFITFHFVCFAWIFFRAPTFGQARVLLGQLGTFSTFTTHLHWKILAALTVGLVSHTLPERFFQRIKSGFINLPGVAQGVLLFLVALILRELANAEAVPFVYFQF